MPITTTIGIGSRIPVLPGLLTAVTTRAGTATDTGKSEIDGFRRCVKKSGSLGITAGEAVGCRVNESRQRPDRVSGMSDRVTGQKIGYGYHPDNRIRRRINILQRQYAL